MFDIGIPEALYRGLQLSQFEVLGEVRKSFQKKQAVVEVLRVRHIPTDKELCMKKMQLICDQDSLLLANELRILYPLNHPHIIKLYGHFVEGDHVYAIYDLAQHSVKKQLKALTEQECVEVVWQLCSALKYLHSREILHRDVNIDNLLMNRTESGAISVKLIDFECAAVFSPARKTQHGTLASLAPEVVDESFQTEKIDSWGVGVVLYHLLTKSQPFQVKGDDVYDRTISKIKLLDYKVPENLDELAKGLLKAIFTLDPNERISVQEIMEHPYIRKYAKTKEEEEQSLPEPPQLAAFQSKINKMEHKESEFEPEPSTNPHHRQLQQKIKKLELALAAKKASQAKPKDILELQKRASELQQHFQRSQQENDSLKQKLKQSQLTCMKYEKEKRSMDDHRLNLQKSKLQLSKINTNVQRVLEQNNRVGTRITELQRQLERLKKQEGGSDSDLFLSGNAEKHRVMSLKQSPSGAYLKPTSAVTAPARQDKSFSKESSDVTKSARRLN